MTHVYIDQDLCTGDALCAEICPEVFVMLDDGLAYVKDGDFIHDNPGGMSGLATFSDDLSDAVREASEECPGECIFIEQDDGSYKAG